METTILVCETPSKYQIDAEPRGVNLGLLGHCHNAVDVTPLPSCP